MQHPTSMTPEEQGGSSAQRKAKYAARKYTPCAESIAMPRPDLASTTSDERAFTSRASPVFQAASSASPDVSPSTSMPTYTVGTDGDMEAFLSDIMGENPIPPDIMDDEYYAFGGYGTLNGSDVDSMDGDEDTNISTAESIDIDPFDYIELKEPNPIPQLMRLWSSADADSRHFRENIRFFNGHFAFTTLGVSLDENYTNMKSGVYTFWAHGTIYHNVHSFGPSSRPEHLQLYFYDDDPNLTHRKAATKQLDQNVVKQLVDILRGNPYSQQFRSLGTHKDNLDDYRIDLNTDQRLDQRRYNKPVSSEVAAIWVEGADLEKRFDRRITLCGNDNQRHSICVTDGSYDPLSYPLFYPMRELGWHPRLPKRNVSWEVVQQARYGRDDDEDAEGNNRLCVSVRDYYCYRLQTRPAIFNPILCGARLLQQWGVDMYIKIESCRLRWYRKNQTKIRADLYKGVVDAILGRREQALLE